MSDSSGINPSRHDGHQWTVIVFNLLPWRGQLTPAHHDALATALKGYQSLRATSLTIEEGFATYEDAAEALREMREAQAGGVEATIEEQRELEAAVAELEAQEAAGPSSATGGGRGGGGAGPESPIDLTMEEDE